MIHESQNGKAMEAIDMYSHCHILRLVHCGLDLKLWEPTCSLGNCRLLYKPPEAKRQRVVFGLMHVLSPAILLKKIPVCLQAINICLHAGSVPFKARTNIDLYKEICEAPLEFPNDVFVSESLKHLLVKLLDKDPESRIHLNGVMSHPWVTHNGLRPIPGFTVSVSSLADLTVEAFISSEF